MQRDWWATEAGEWALFYILTGLGTLAFIAFWTCLALHICQS